MDTDSADTDPLYADTDTDGLSDSREIELGTNPERVDTDGDSIDDDRELKVGADPTLHDYEGPEISIFAASYWTTAWPPETHYRVGYGATDPSGVMRVRIQKEGETRIDSRFGDAPTSVGANQYFTTGVVESSVTALSGTSVEVKATDRHRNHRAMTALERSNFYGSLAKEIGPKSSVKTAGDLGLLSGFTVGAGGTAKTAKAILEDPFGFLGTLQQMASMMTQLGLLEKILKTLPSQMVKSVQDKQDRSNPYDKQTQEDHYKAFQYNWYLGYGGYFLLSMVVGGQATKAAKNTKTFSKVVDKLDRNGKLTQANRYLDSAKANTVGRATGRTKSSIKSGYRLGKLAAKESAGLSKRGGRQILSGAKTVGKKVEVRYQLRKISGPKLSNLDASERRQLGNLLARTPDGGARVIQALDGETLDDLLSVRRATAPDGDSDTLDQETRAAIIRQYDDKDLSDDEIDKRIDEITEKLNDDALSPRAKEQAINAMEDAGADGFWFVRKVPASRINKLVENDIDLKKHADGLGVIRRSKKSVGDNKGDVGEIIAQKQIKERFDSEEFEVIPSGSRKGIYVYFDDDTNKEFDHMVLDSDGDIIKVYETKIGAGDAKDAEGALRFWTAKMRPESDTQIEKISPEKISGAEVKVDPFFDDSDLISVGPKGKANGYDEALGEYSSEELKALHETASTMKEI